MRPDLRERRERLWELFVLQNRAYTDAVEQIAAEYDVSDSTVKQDIRRMENWLPKLQNVAVSTGASRMRELRYLRQRLQEMRAEAQARDEPDRELKILREIRANINDDVQIAQSLGLLQDEPERHEHRVYTVEDADSETIEMWQSVSNGEGVPSGTEVPIEE